MAGLFSAPQAPSIPPPPIAPNPNNNQATADSMNQAAAAQTKKQGQASTMLTGQSGADTSSATVTSRSLLGS